MSRYCGGVQRSTGGFPSKPAGTSRLLAACAVPAALLLGACGAHGDLMSAMALPSEQTPGFVDGGIPGSPAGSGTLDLTTAQRAYLDDLAGAGIHPSSELRALSIGSYVCQARAAGQNDQAVRDYVAPMVRSDVADAHVSAPQLAPMPADVATAEYVRIATEKLC